MNEAMRGHLQRAGVRIGGMDADCECVVCSSAIAPTHPASEAARSAGIPIVRRGELLGSLLSSRKLVAVCGAHMSGLPLNYQLTERGGRLHRRCRTAAHYRMFALPGGPPARPGLLRVDGGGAIEVEVWELPTASFGSFVAAIPGPLGIGALEMDDGEQVKGFLCEAYATKTARDITDLGGWRRYLMAEQTV